MSTSAVSRFLTLDRRDQVVVVAATALLPPTTLALRRWGHQQVRHRFDRWSGRSSARRSAADHLDRARRIGLLVTIVADNLPMSVRCLPQSEVTRFLLRRRGLDPELCFGVRREEGELRFHAWVELDGAPVNDRSDVRSQYLTFAGVPDRDSAWE